MVRTLATATTQYKEREMYIVGALVQLNCDGKHVADAECIAAEGRQAGFGDLELYYLSMTNGVKSEYK
jgi:hypothetical protein